EYSDFAVIYRTNIQSRALVDVFMDMRIPFSIKDSVVTIYDHWASRDILSYLKIAVRQNNNEDWIRIINKPFRYISRDNLNQIKDDKDFINSLITKSNLHPKQVKTINDLDIDINYLKHQCPQDAISYIRTTLDYDKYILDYCMNRKIKTTGLIEILNEIESSASNFETIESYLAHIEKVKEELAQNNNKKEMDGVVFTTMHSAKGLEFRNVYIIGINEGTIPHEKSYDIDDEEKKLEQIEEERRLMYVGMTRAEESLTLSSPINKYGKKAFKSRFLDDVKNPTKEELDSVKIGDKIYHKSFKEGRIVGKDGDMVSVKFKSEEKTLDYKLCIRNDIITKL
ncbi:MAG: 3'-5' exonuclease, partial [Romboutsia sp.]|uniref:3'-5' exonuclease n=1 Tax=Romboutsia sp. TaxID=1965302 RepID=UPI003F3F0F44